MDWLQFAKDAKAAASAKEAFITPLVIIETAGEALAIIKSPEEDKHQALRALHMALQMGFVDKAVMIMDAHYEHIDLKKRVEPFLKYMNMGKSLQERKHSGDTSVKDALVCVDVDATNKTISNRTIQYKTIGRKVEWNVEDDMKDAVVSGYIYDSINKIFEEREKNHTVKDALDAVREKAAFSEERLQYHSMRGFFEVLKSLGYEVVDLVSDKHPEWAG
jgi:hypothetical protein